MRGERGRPASLGANSGSRPHASRTGPEPEGEGRGRRRFGPLNPESRILNPAIRHADVLSFISLLKRSVSTVAACASTLQAVASRFQGLVTQEAESQESRRQRLGTLRDYQRKIERFGVASAEEEEERHSLETEDLAQQLATLQREVRSGSRTLSRSASVVEALDNLVALAQEARPHDPKLAQLAAEIETIRAQEPAANVLVYTEYTTSQAAAAEVLRNRGLTVLTLCGDDDEATRTRVTDTFRTRDGLVLVSTDASAEGLNLHDRCHYLLHLALPFNLNRLEQRNGRIDRYGRRMAVDALRRAHSRKVIDPRGSRRRFLPDPAAKQWIATLIGSAG
ncbi:MAG: hypothetical protein HZB55_07520 [Deltaproteobacteria bacterium]|nr:hypothetical protein [Deltaproteobacteria bacterium]